MRARCNNDDPSQRYAANAYGYSRVLTRGDEGTHRALKQVTPGSALTRCSRVLTGYSQSTHGVLAEYSRGTSHRTFSSGSSSISATVLRCAARSAGLHGVLTGYSRGTHGVRPTNSSYCPGAKQRTRRRPRAAATPALQHGRKFRKFPAARRFRLSEQHPILDRPALLVRKFPGDAEVSVPSGSFRKRRADWMAHAQRSSASRALSRTSSSSSRRRMCTRLHGALRVLTWGTPSPHVGYSEYTHAAL